MTEGCGLEKSKSEGSNVDLYTLGRRWKRLRRVCTRLATSLAGLPQTGARGDDGRNHRRDPRLQANDAADSQGPHSNATYCEPQNRRFAVAERTEIFPFHL